MNNKIIIQVIRNIILLILGYIKNTCSKRLKNAFIAGKNEFLRTFWKGIKEDIQDQLNLVCSQVQEYMKSSSIQEKEEAAFEILFQKIKLPFFLKPFKSLIKKSLKKKLESVIQELLNKANQVIL